MEMFETLQHQTNAMCCFDSIFPKVRTRHFSKWNTKTRDGPLVTQGNMGHSFEGIPVDPPRPAPGSIGVWGPSLWFLTPFCFLGLHTHYGLSKGRSERWGRRSLWHSSPRRSPGAVLRIDKKECDRNEIEAACPPDSSLSLQRRTRGSESVLLGEEEAQWAVVP